MSAFPLRRRSLVALVIVLVLGGAALVGRWTLLGVLGSGVTPTVGADTPATAMDLSTGTGNNSPEIVADPVNRQFIIMASRIDVPDFSCALEVSGDGGKGWIGIDPVASLPQGVDKCYGPEAAFDRHGRLYYLFVGLAGGGNQPVGAFLSSSTDMGATFSAPKMVLGPANFSVRMLIDPTMGKAGRIQLAWLHSAEVPPLGGFPATTNPILTAHSDDGGNSFSEPVQINSPDESRVVGPALALGPSHRVYVGYYDLGADARDYQGLEGPTWDGAWSLLVAGSSDGGLTFGQPDLVSSKVVPSERIMLVFTMPPPALVAWAGHVCLAWSDSRNGDPDVFTRCTSAGHWGQEVRVNHDPLGDGKRQYLPRLSVAKDRLDIIYFDRQDPIGRYNAVMYSYSSNAGRSFHLPVAVSAHVSDTRIGAQYGVVSAAGQVEFGSRLGLLSFDNVVIAAWPDTRNSTLLSTSQDIFVGSVRYSGRGQWWADLAGPLVVTLGLMVAYRRRRRAKRRGSPEAPSDETSSLAGMQVQTEHLSA